MSRIAQTNYSTWTREELLAKLQSFEKINSKPLKHQKPPRPMDFSKYETVSIALKVAYLGEKYHGFAIQDATDVTTVEGEILKSLQKIRLVEDIKSCNFSRCGRTDTGVSGLGQVISLTVRSNLLKDNSVVRTEFDFPSLINRTLPHDIRILAWCKTKPDFSARFDCIYREYKYFFVKSDLDLEMMKQAATYFIGQHNFMHFCKIPKDNPPTSFERIVYNAEIVEQQNQICVFTIRGSGFLYHQVRCMMGILFQIGKKLKSPDFVLEMMNVNLCKLKPQYEMASEENLVLYDCGFTGLDWIADKTEHVQDHFKAIMEKCLIKSQMISLFYEESLKDSKVTDIKSNKKHKC